jgi:thiol-disulfide isomerase/thioredoxin
MRVAVGLVYCMVMLDATAPSFGQAKAGLKERLDAIAKRQHAVRRQLSEDNEGKTTKEAQKPGLDRFYAATSQNTEEVLKLVAADPDDPAVVEALKFVIKSARAGPGDESYRAMVMLRDHVRDPGMGELCGQIFYFIHAPEAEWLLRAVLEQNPNRSDRGQACHTLAVYLQLQAKMVRRIRKQPETIEEYVHERHKAAAEHFVKTADPEALDQQAESYLERVIAEFGDVKNGYDDRPLGALAQGELVELRNLSVGKVAPEISGNDEEGKPFHLGDYRGKVVVLTFSGNWCGPCVGMYPQERELVSKHKDRPFALVSVNTDADVATLKKSKSSGEITWRCWWDGGPTGPITTRWGILSFPSIFVLDRTGVIRFKNARGAELDQAVASLLDEAQAARSAGR